MALTYLLTGGNMGDRLNYLNKAKANLQVKAGTLIKESKIYETEPWGFCDSSDFLNQVLLIDTKLSPQELLLVVNTIENDMGRERNSTQYSSRVIDIDILLYDNRVINECNLVVPHPQIHNRLFTLMPLVELCPDYIHPVFNKSITTLMKECDDKSKVKLIDNG